MLHVSFPEEEQTDAWTEEQANEGEEQNNHTSEVWAEEPAGSGEESRKRRSDIRG